MLTPDSFSADSAPKSETFASTLLSAIQPIGQDHLPEGASVLVESVGLDGDFLRLRLHRPSLLCADP